MKLRNKKTGEIREIKEILIDGMFNVNSLAELNEEWEDYEEPKEYWYIDIDGEISYGVTDNIIIKEMKEIGNYFETKEEAEKAVEKLKAWKRLKDEGFKFDGWETSNSGIVKTKFDLWSGLTKEITDDLDILFGGEE